MDIKYSNGYIFHKNRSRDFMQLMGATSRNDLQSDPVTKTGDTVATDSL